MKEEKMNELSRILNGSKQYEFDYGDYGMSVLKLTNYNTGKTVSIDLGILMNEYPEVMEEIILNDDEEKEEW